MPSQPFSPSLAMNWRRLGVSTIWAMFSRVRSNTSGSSLASRKASTSSANANCSGENVKFTRAPGRESDGSSVYRHDAVGDERLDLGVVQSELVSQHVGRVLAQPWRALGLVLGDRRQLHRVAGQQHRLLHVIGAIQGDEHVAGLEVGLVHDVAGLEAWPHRQAGRGELLARLTLAVLRGPPLDAGAQDGLEVLTPAGAGGEARVVDPLG